MYNSDGDNMIKVAVSACLVGKNTKYDGTNNYNQAVMDYLKDKEYILICPEVFGGLLIPRIPIEIVDGKAMNKQGQDVSEAFERGSQMALSLLEKYPSIHTIILKDSSPSCGSKEIYDGSFSGKKISGQGYFTRLISDKYKIINENEVNDLFIKK